MTDTHAQRRTQSHAKLLRYKDRQALVYLARDNDGELVITVQVWCLNEDHQVRARIGMRGVPTDSIGEAFEDLDDEKLAAVLNMAGFDDALAEAEAG